MNNILQKYKKTMIPKAPKHHFTELSLFSDLLVQFLQASKLSLRMLGSEISNEQDICNIYLLMSKPPPQMQVQQKQKTSKVKLFQIKVIQIQHILKFYVIEIRNEIIEHANNLFEVNPQLGIIQGLKVTCDEFWFAYPKYLPKKISNSYLLTDISRESHEKINQIFNNRIKKNLLEPFREIDAKREAQLLIKALNHNYILFNRLLKPKQYQNLECANSLIYKTLHRQAQYKAIYEERWGRTGFELNQRNWIKAYQNKIKNLKKMGKI